MKGRQVYEKAIQMYSNQKAIIASGYSTGEDVDTCLKLGVGAFAKKPYSFEHLFVVTREVLAAERE